MIKTAIAIPRGKTEIYLKALQDSMPELPSIACDANAFEDEQTIRQLATGDVKCPILMNLTPDDTIAAIQTAEETHALSIFFKNLYSTMTLAATQNGTESFTLPMRLDRIPGEAWQESLEALIPKMESFLNAPMPGNFSCMLPVRFPKTFPGSEELTRSLGICNAVNEAYGMKHSLSSIKANLSLLAIIYPDEEMPKGHRVTPATFRENDLVASVNALMFNDQPAAGETLFDDEQMEWADFLKDISYNGTVIFNPVACPDENLTTACDDIAEWMNYYE